ncbi:MAG: hypothetical protein E7631_01255 [Ruminococcaceae bacterium]|nr:hypothetical protein [Oscillospiraceae bacterium]
MIQIQLQQKLCTQTLLIPEVGILTYILTEDTLPDGVRYYSVTVQITDPCRETIVLDKRTVRDITCDRDLAFCLFWKICRGKVTPCTLLEVLSDLLP